jgi:iron only hydrogenase large subunit-like protein
MNLITINKVDCKDCYKCVRYCPVKSIRVLGGHAEVEHLRCIGCGGCVPICPQKAKQVRSDVEIVRGLLASGRQVIASLAPSAVGIYDKKLPAIIATLKKIGFSRVEDTARTAEAVARATADFAKKSHIPIIGTACPAVVNLITRFHPELVENLAPVMSPMVAHAQLLREEYGEDTPVVFIGPCVAKKGEATEANIAAALTFDELANWLLEDGIDIYGNGKADFDNPPAGIARIFPLPNGMIRSADLPTDLLATEIISISGLREVMELLTELPNLDGIKLIEPLACVGGCINGPGSLNGPSPLTRRASLLAVDRIGHGATPNYIQACYPPEPLILPQPDAEEMAVILRRTGKRTIADEHNCGACGYDTCRDKAIAVFQGMAEAEMCIPYMRSRAESFAGVVIRSTPNGIVVIDSALRILDANPAFEHLFNTTLPEIIGRPIRVLLDPAPFERVQRTRAPFIRQEFAHNELILRESIFPVPDEEMTIGIYINVTDDVNRRDKHQLVKQETLGKARQVIEKQMRVAQEIAGLLGETTAETKVLLTRLIRLYDEEE